MEFCPRYWLNGVQSSRNSSALGGHKLEWLPDAARRLFASAVAQGWDFTLGGLYYTTEYDGAPRVRDRLWWPLCEGVGAAHFLVAQGGDASIEGWYRRFWDFIARHIIDRREGGWRLQLNDSLTPISGYFVGKPDLYHALQACLIPLYPTDGSLTRGISDANSPPRDLPQPVPL